MQMTHDQMCNWGEMKDQAGAVRETLMKDEHLDHKCYLLVEMQ